MIRFSSATICALMFLICGSAEATKIRPAFTSALEFGGDKLIDITYSDGSKSSIEAGRGIVFGGGVNIDLSETVPHTFEAQLTAAIKWTSAKEAKNGNVDWYRFPLELISFYHNTERNYRLGGGLTYQIANELKGSGDAAAAAMKFDNGAGYVLEGDYFFGEKKDLILGVRYTGINYRAQNAASSTINGSSWGIAFNYVW